MTSDTHCKCRSAGNLPHCHIDGVERAYRFIDIDTLIEDFIATVEERKST